MSKEQNEVKNEGFGEPWHRATEEECGYLQSAIIVRSDGLSVGEMTAGFPDNNARINDSFRADRIVACVNAMAGIPDPAAFVEAARRVAEWSNPPASESDLSGLRLAVADLAATLETNP